MRKVIVIASIMFLLTVSLSTLAATLFERPASLVVSAVFGIIIGIFGTPSLFDAWEARDA